MKQKNIKKMTKAFFIFLGIFITFLFAVAYLAPSQLLTGKSITLGKTEVGQ